jgi:coupling of ubiquitin conjugation to ER degradation protein 1
MAEQTINIPQLLTVLVIGFFAFRWFFSKMSPSQHSNQSSGRRVNPAHIEQVAQMFPQLGRREIAWDLHLNGGNVAATTERILSGRALDAVSENAHRRSGYWMAEIGEIKKWGNLCTDLTFRSLQPPPSFQPPLPAPSSRTGSRDVPSSRSSKSSHPDLITRYNLGSKLGDSSSSSSGAEKKVGWSSNKNERQKLLQQRREDMILAARKKLEEKGKAKG